MDYKVLEKKIRSKSGEFPHYREKIFLTYVVVLLMYIEGSTEKTQRSSDMLGVRME